MRDAESPEAAKAEFRGLAFALINEAPPNFNALKFKDYAASTFLSARVPHAKKPVPFLATNGISITLNAINPSSFDEASVLKIIFLRWELSYTDDPSNQTKERQTETLRSTSLTMSSLA